MRSIVADEDRGQVPDIPDDDPACAGCGRRLWYRGRRRSCTVWECENPTCPVVLAELHDPLMAEPAGGGR